MSLCTTQCAARRCVPQKQVGSPGLIAALKLGLVEPRRWDVPTTSVVAVGMLLHDALVLWHGPEWDTMQCASSPGDRPAPLQATSQVTLVK